MQDDAEAACLLASGGDYLAAAERCLQSKKFLERATLGQLLHLHGWLLRVGTTHAASLAVDLWDEQIAAGRLQPDYIEAQAAARLALGRGLLRQAVGAATPALSVKQQGAAGRSKADEQQGKHGRGQKKQKDVGSYARAAAVAAAVPNTPQPAPLPTASLAGLHQQLLQLQAETDRAEAAQLVHKAVSVLSDAQQGFITANQPAGVLEALSWGLAAKPPEEITVGQWQLAGAGSSSGRLCDALEVVGHTQQTVALLQALASTVTVVKGKRHCCVPVGLWACLLAECEAAGLLHVLMQVDQSAGVRSRHSLPHKHITFHTNRNLNAAAVAATAGRGVPSVAGRPPLPKDRISQLLRSLERFFGIKPLADNAQQTPLTFRCVRRHSCATDGALVLC